MKTNNLTHRNQQGFSLIELLIVISILVILASMMTAGSLSFRQRARETKTKAQLAQMETALEAYRNDFLMYPGDGTPVEYENDNSYILEQLSAKDKNTGAYVPAIVNDPNWNGPYFDPKEEDVRVIGGIRRWVDAWGNVINMRLAADMTIGDGKPPFNRDLSFDLWSSGPNGTNDSGVDASGGIVGDDIGNF